MKSVFEYRNYKTYLQNYCGEAGKRTGKAKEIATVSQCSTTYVSQVINGSRHFNLEQAERLNALLAHDEDESHFFLLLVQKSRAGSKALEYYFTNQIEKMSSLKLNLTSRIGVKEKLSKEDQSIYYSQWYYSAIHVAVSISELQTKEKLVHYFNLPAVTVHRTLDFLVKSSLIVEKDEKYVIGTNHIHLSDKSENIIKHHINWRVQAIVSFEKPKQDSLHYSGTMTLSDATAEKIRLMLIDNVKEANAEAIKGTKEEKVFGFNVDFFNLSRK
ncbi:MAG: TIGR02147 family protein [Pseudobdellovibrionaceae bacterium]